MRICGYADMRVCGYAFSTKPVSNGTLRRFLCGIHSPRVRARFLLHSNCTSRNVQNGEDFRRKALPNKTHLEFQECRDL